MRTHYAFFCLTLGSLILASAALLMPAPAAESVPAAATSQTPQAAPKQNGQIWQCVTNGVKTFSNNPCGNNATPVALRPINTMKPTPVVRGAYYAAGTGPRYTKEYTDQNLYPDQDVSGQAFGDNSSSDVQGDPGVQGFVYLPLRANHAHRRAHHDDSTSQPHRASPKPPMSAPRKN